MPIASVAKEIHDVGGVDDRYAQHLAATFASVMANHRRGATIRFYVLSTGLLPDNERKLASTVEKFGASVRFVKVDGASFADFPVTGHINRAMYLRLAIPRALPEDVGKVLYLDSDTIVTEDIAEVWETDIAGVALAAVRDTWAYYRCDSLGLSPGAYFNSGVLLLNVARWRTEAIDIKVLAYIAERGEKLHFPDQDALNAVLSGDWLELPHRWNAVDMKLWTETKPPSIIHYTDVSKPWHRDNQHRFKREYYRYLRLTEWRAYKPAIDWKVVGIRLFRATKNVAKRMIPKKVLIAIKGREVG